MLIKESSKLFIVNSNILRLYKILCIIIIFLKDAIFFPQHLLNAVLLYYNFEYSNVDMKYFASLNIVQLLMRALLNLNV
jgi:hypothetical protein